MIEGGWYLIERDGNEWLEPDSSWVAVCLASSGTVMATTQEETREYDARERPHLCDVFSRIDSGGLGEALPDVARDYVISRIYDQGEDVTARVTKIIGA